MFAEHLIGRADELRSLERLLDELARGRPGAIELAGEPGIGKTRLLREVAARAEARGHLVLSGSASELKHDLARCRGALSRPLRRSRRARHPRPGSCARDGQGELFLVLYQILGRAWYVRGKLDEATELVDGAIEAERLLGQAQFLAGNLFNRSVVAVAVGDLDTALTTAQEGVDLTRDLGEGFVPAWAAVRLAGALLETGQPGSAVELLLSCAGGEEQALIPGSWRAYCLELLTRCWLALGHRSQAERAAACAQATAVAEQLPLAAAWADRAAAAVALYAGDPGRAAERALASAAAADKAGAPIEAALSRIAAGRALGHAGQAERAVAELQRAAAQLDACGAVRYRNEAERELGKLGHRIHRRTRPGKPGAAGVECLTDRELQVARLVADRKTNPQIAAELFLSQKTVETHLRNIFHKIDVSSRVGLARAIERADRRTGTPERQ